MLVVGGESSGSKSAIGWDWFDVGMDGEGAWDEGRGISGAWRLGRDGEVGRGTVECVESVSGGAQ